MRIRIAAIFMVLTAITATLAPAQGYYRRQPAPPLLRWTGSADWEYILSDGTLDGQETTTRFLGQRYSLDLDTFIWDPRFNTLSLGLDLLRSDTSTSHNGDTDADSLGYRLETTFFPGRSFPLHIFARRSDLDVVGSAIVDNDRDTDAWGLDWSFKPHPTQRVRMLYDRSRSDLIGSVPLKERRSAGIFDFDQEFENGELTFHYGLNEQAERTTGVEYTRQNFVLRDLNRFGNGSTFRVLASHQLSEGLFSNGQRDELTNNRAALSYDIPRGRRAHFRVSYDFNQNDSEFLDNTNHGVRGQVHYRFAEHWQAQGSLSLAQLRNSSPTTDQEQDRRGATAGLRYERSWSGVKLGVGYAFGYTTEEFKTDDDDRQLRSHDGDVSLTVPVGAASEIFGRISAARDENDVTDVGFTFDENRASLGWEVRLTERWRLRTVGTYRDLTYDTVNFGIQESEEIGAEASLNHPAGGFNASYRSSEGISEFFPDPTSGSIFLQGTDLVSESQRASLGAHWRLSPYLRMRLSALLDDREFTTIGKERILSYHPEIQYDRSTWRIAAGFSHYERTDSIDFLDDTWRLRITKLFY